LGLLLEETFRTSIAARLLVATDSTGVLQRQIKLVLPRDWGKQGTEDGQADW
jgi:hypothetical protein